MRTEVQQLYQTIVFLINFPHRGTIGFLLFLRDSVVRPSIPTRKNGADAQS